MTGDTAVALALAVSSAVLVISGWKRVPGAGIIATILAIGLLFATVDGFSLGLGAPSSWAATIFIAVVAGVVIQVLSITVLEPLAERVTGATHDLSIVESVKGSWKPFFLWLLTVWVFVAFLEEVVYRGFLQGEITRLLGGGAGSAVIGLLASSLVFGASHWYQGRAGAVSTTITGALLGVLFIWSDHNLWLPILTHGVIDTVGLAAIAIGADRRLGRLLRK